MSTQGRVGRNYIFRVVTPDNQFIEVKPPFTIDFDITRNTLASANTAKITIYNLSRNNRAQIFRDRFDTTQNFAISLFAGYGSRLHEVFRGNALEAFSYRRGPDWITELDCLDGLNAIQNGFVTQSYSAGTSLRDILSGIINAMPGVIRGVFGEPTEGTTERGVALSGTGTDALAELSDGQYFIDNEQVNFLGRNETLPNITTTLDPSILLQTPRRRRQLLEIVTLFEPVIQVGQTYNIESIEPIYNGSYKVLGFNHKVLISESVAGDARTTMQLDIGTAALRAARETIEA